MKKETSAERFIRIKEVQFLTGRARSTIYGDPNFPKPIKLSHRECAWLESEVTAWMQQRIDRRKVASSRHWD